MGSQLGRLHQHTGRYARLNKLQLLHLLCRPINSINGTPFAFSVWRFTKRSMSLYAQKSLNLLLIAVIFSCLITDVLCRAAQQRQLDCYLLQPRHYHGYPCQSLGTYITKHRNICC
jgi:hypothetical protein